jgi:hypothetical protein
MLCSDLSLMLLTDSVCPLSQLWWAFASVSIWDSSENCPGDPETMYLTKQLTVDLANA